MVEFVPEDTTDNSFTAAEDVGTKSLALKLTLAAGTINTCTYVGKSCMYTYMVWAHFSSFSKIT